MRNIKNLPFAFSAPPSIGQSLPWPSNNEFANFQIQILDRAFKKMMKNEVDMRLLATDAGDKITMKLVISNSKLLRPLFLLKILSHRPEPMGED